MTHEQLEVLRRLHMEWRNAIAAGDTDRVRTLTKQIAKLR